MDEINQPKATARKLAWAERNPEKVKKAHRIYYEKNWQERRAASAAWRAANPDKVKAASKARWALVKGNPEMLEAKNKRNRANRAHRAAARAYLLAQIEMSKLREMYPHGA